MLVDFFSRAKGFVFTKGGGAKGGGASRVGLCGRGGANSGGGAPMQALAPGRWRPSVRHCKAVTARDIIYLLDEDIYYFEGLPNLLACISGRP